MPTVKRPKSMQKRVRGGILSLDWTIINPRTGRVSTADWMEEESHYVKPSVLFRSFARDGSRIHKSEGPAERKSDRQALRTYLQSHGFYIGRDGLIRHIGAVRPAKKKISGQKSFTPKRKWFTIQKELNCAAKDKFFCRMQSTLLTLSPVQ